MWESLPFHPCGGCSPQGGGRPDADFQTSTSGLFQQRPHCCWSDCKCSQHHVQCLQARAWVWFSRISAHVNWHRVSEQSDHPVSCGVPWPGEDAPLRYQGRPCSLCPASLVSDPPQQRGAAIQFSGMGPQTPGLWYSPFSGENLPRIPWLWEHAPPLPPSWQRLSIMVPW